eukprot:Macronucleus_6113.p1 GENE.Macronucleus_6113~~Macronucleus_6113.p1  ORF type:complete len:117 (+),score=20.16 Macronucleus_6113:1-351(+)
MKVVSALQKLCKDCYVVRRGKKLYLRCKSHPRHKRRQGFSTLNYLAAEEGLAPVQKSYDGFKVNSVFQQEQEATKEQSSVSSRCTMCVKPLGFDIGSSIKAKQQYLDLMAEAKDEE